MTKKHMEEIAHTFADARMSDRRDGKVGASVNLEIALVETFKQINPRFDVNKFFKRVCYLEDKRLGRA